MTNDPSWANTPLSRLDLEEVVGDIARKWNLSEGNINCSATPHRIDLEIGTKKASVLNWDISWRFLMWTCLFLILPASALGSNLRLFPEFAGTCAGAGVMAGLGVLCYMQLKSNFNSRVLKYIDDVARGRAVSFEELLFASVLALWPLINRPLFSGIRNYLVWWWNLDNNFDKSVGEPVREALVGLYKVDLSTNKNPRDGWSERNYFDQKMQTAFKNAQELQSLWFRSVALPFFIHCTVLGAAGFAFVVIVGLPYVQPFLDALGR
jgi:hypothetical protein